MTEGWGKQAACRELSAEEADRIFFPPEGHATRSKDVDYTEALSFCNRCPVKDECLAVALTAEAGASKGSRYGIFGGRSPRERWALSRARGEGGRSGPTPMDPDEWPHGTHSSYTHHRCRCGTCQEFRRNYMARKRGYMPRKRGAA